mgnify:CR=1 FL=1
MTIETVRDNLRNTIAGKEMFLDQLARECNRERLCGEVIALDATVKFLEINIDELKRILVEVEACLD